MAGISIGRVLEKLDEYLGKNDYPGAERHLQYWLAEAKTICDDRGAFALLNELIGLYRKCGNEHLAIEVCKETLALAQKMGISDSVGGATACLNAATAYKSFGDPLAALPLYEKARIIYERELPANDSRLGGLYNNMALALTNLNRFAEAEELYLCALGIMQQAKNGELEQAITYLNLAELEERKVGLEAAEQKITEYLALAETLLRTKTVPRNGYYAFVAEKCAATFGYYGFFAFENELLTLANQIRTGETS